jgi:potassium channel subfamily K
MLCGLTASLAIYDPPIGPDHVYSQAYWSAVIAAALYFLLAFLLMINMLGYFLGRYPQHFSLTDDQRTLILQMTAFVVWLLIGAAIFQKVLGISFADALYFCDITVLTLGFGDVVATTSVGRGLIWPYAVIGIIQLGLVIGSIHQFAKEVHYDNVVRKHIEHKRESTFARTMTLQQLDGAREEAHAQGKELAFPPVTHPHHHPHQPIRNTIHALANSRKPRLIVMREEKDRFDAMRAIQYETMRFRRWNDLVISIIAFGIVWSCGAVVFWKLEDDMDYFESLYFCFCSLITIGYGDFTPKSNPGRPFFVMWSLIAIPTMTMLISQMTDTVVAGLKHSTETFADYFVMPDSESYRSFFSRFPRIMRIIQKREENKRVKLGFPIGAQAGDVAGPEEGALSTEDPEKTAPTATRRRSSATERPTRTIEELAHDTDPTPFELAEQLAFAIRRTTQDVREGKRKRYNYEEWVEFTRLIQFTDPRSRPSSSGAGASRPEGSISLDADEFGVLNWDWIGENSPMLAHSTEPEWILDRLCESLIRYVSTQEQARAAAQGQVDDQTEEPTLKKERDLGIDES